ncbi:ANTAR domain-containing protein [Mycobacterium sp. NPDC048908]|uniref:ANTAR domain-containing protein n=1 Tax=Mycobacterium sp. NPDC048908 TaxID=3364292 RepID=UPI0037230B38
MAAAYFQPHLHPQLVALMHRILERMQADLLDALGLAIVIHDKRHDQPAAVVAAAGVGADFVNAQLGSIGGPVPDALAYQVPVLSIDLWTDDRWPDLTLETIKSIAPHHESSWDESHGAAAVPGVWADDATVVVCCVLKQPANAATVATLITYEQLVSAALITSAAENASAIADIITVLQSRGAIEQAKGALMGLVRCDAEHAWRMLRRASQEFNVKLRELAVALVEHISGAPAEQPDTGTPITPDERTREAAQLMWAALSETPSSQ